MKALVGSEEKAETLAAKIKSLQDEWKQLGPLPRARDQELWNEFKTAADEALSPARRPLHYRPNCGGRISKSACNWLHN